MNSASKNSVCTGTIGVEEIEGFFDLLPLLRRQALAAASVFPVTTGHGRGSLLASVVARLHATKTQSSAQLSMWIFKGEISSASSNPYHDNSTGKKNRNRARKQKQFIHYPM
jgi:hypothetical protein